MYNNRGVARGKSDDFYEAILDFNMALEINPSYANAYLNRANAKYLIGDFDGAFSDAREASSLGD